jgi:hypothetical protein
MKLRSNLTLDFEEILLKKQAFCAAGMPLICLLSSGSALGLRELRTLCRRPSGKQMVFVRLLVDLLFTNLLNRGDPTIQSLPNGGSREL